MSAADLQTILAACPVQVEGGAFKFSHKSQQTFHVAHAIEKSLLLAMDKV